MRPKDFMGTRESRQVQAWLVGSDKLKSKEDPKAWRQSDCLVVLRGRESRLHGEAGSGS